jgi:hypothetical protein
MLQLRMFVGSNYREYVLRFPPYSTYCSLYFTRLENSSFGSKEGYHVDDDRRWMDIHSDHQMRLYCMTPVP